MKKFYLHYSGLKVARDGEVIVPETAKQAEHRTYGIQYKDKHFRVHFNGKIYLVHVLVAEVFLNNNQPVPKGYHVHHIDENPANNTPENLLILTPPEHMRIHKTGNQYFKGKHHTEETKRKLSEYHTGLHHTEETKKKLSELNTGKNNPNWGKFGADHPSSIPVIGTNKTTGEVREFGSIVEASRALGIANKNISNNLNGWSKSAGGWRFEYAT